MLKEKERKSPEYVAGSGRILLKKKRLSQKLEDRQGFEEGYFIP